MNWDSIKSRFGGEWYDEWWCSAFSWFALHEGGRGRWWEENYHKEFFTDINAGWLEMYPQPKKERPSLLEFIQQTAYEV